VENPARSKAWRNANRALKHYSFFVMPAFAGMTKNKANKNSWMLASPSMTDVNTRP